MFAQGSDAWGCVLEGRLWQLWKKGLDPRGQLRDTQCAGEDQQKGGCGRRRQHPAAPRSLGEEGQGVMASLGLCS